MIAIIFALPEESRDFRRAMRATHSAGAPGNQWECALGESAVRIVHCGIGHAAAARSIAELLRGELPEFVVAAGFAGALVPHLAIGDLILAENFSDPALLAAASKCGLSAHAGILLTAEHPVETVADKRALAARGGIAVDMETSAIATACRAAGVPLLAIRAISDRADEPLPVPFHVWFDLTHQRPRLASLLWHLTRHPDQIVLFLRFVHGLRPAREALADFLLRLLAGRRFL